MRDFFFNQDKIYLSLQKFICIFLQFGERTTFSPKYSYGWQRAEILGALINGVFLMSLCLSIFIEALQRFFYVQGLMIHLIVVVVVIIVVINMK